MTRPRLPSYPERPVLSSIKDLSAGGFTLDDRELALFDSIAKEHTEKSGTPVLYWHYDRKRSTVDPVYDEPENRVFDGPYKVVGNVTYPDSMPEAREQGLRTQWNASLWIPRRALEEAGAPEPDVGDVVLLWSNSYFISDGVQEAKVPGAQFMFVVTDSNSDGHLFDTPSFVGFRLEIERRSEYTPERFLKSQ